jgi:hypothetical protein
MPLSLAGIVGPQNVANGNLTTPLRQDNYGSLVTSDINGVYGEQALQGNAYVYTTASQALLLSATTGGHPTVINPVGSGVIFVPTALRISFISGTTVIGGVVLGTTLNVGGGAATAAPIATATLVAKKTAAIGGNGSVVGGCLWSPTTNTFAAAPTVDFATGINLGAAAPTGSGSYEAKFDASIMYYPGTAMSVCYTVTTSTALFAISILGLEIPVTPG